MIVALIQHKFRIVGRKRIAWCESERLEAMLKDAELNSLPNGRHKDCKKHPHLYLHVRGGSKTWLMRYKIRGSSVIDLSLGSYPSISLKEARLEAARHNLDIAQGRCPKTRRDAETRRQEQESITFKDAAVPFVRKQIANYRNTKSQYRLAMYFDKYIYPAIGEMKLKDISIDDIYSLLDPVWEEKYPTAKRLQQGVKAVFDYSTARGFYDKRNPADISILKHGLSKVRHKEAPHPSLHHANTRSLYHQLCSVDCRTAYALRWTILSGSRTCEVLKAKWSEINHDLKLWEIPAENMKNGEAFAVPMTGEHFGILDSMEAFRKPGGRIFELSGVGMLQRLRKVECRSLIGLA